MSIDIMQTAVLSCNFSLFWKQGYKLWGYFAKV